MTQSCKSHSSITTLEARKAHTRPRGQVSASRSQLRQARRGEAVHQLHMSIHALLPPSASISLSLSLPRFPPRPLSLCPTLSLSLSLSLSRSLCIPNKAQTATVTRGLFTRPHNVLLLLLVQCGNYRRRCGQLLLRFRLGGRASRSHLWAGASGLGRDRAHGRKGSRRHLHEEEEAEVPRALRAYRKSKWAQGRQRRAQVASVEDHGEPPCQPLFIHNKPQELPLQVP